MFSRQKDGPPAAEVMARIGFTTTYDGFAEAYAAITQKYPDAIKAERIVFVKGKVDKKRETPSRSESCTRIDAPIGGVVGILPASLDPSVYGAEVVDPRPGLGQH